MISERGRILVSAALLPALLFAGPATAAPPSELSESSDSPESPESAEPPAEANTTTDEGEAEPPERPEPEPESVEPQPEPEPEPVEPVEGPVGPSEADEDASVTSTSEGSGIDARVDPNDAGKTAPQLFDEGRNAYALGNYEQAVSKFEAAWLLSNEPALLFNLGQAYWQWHAIKPELEYLRRARKLFENYDDLLRGSEGYDSAEVEGIVTVISSQLSAAEQAEAIRAQMAATPPAGFDAAAAEAEQRRRTTKALTISGSIMITLGSLALVTGVAGLITRGATGFSLKQAGGGEAGKTNPNSAEDDARLRDTYLLGGRIGFGGLIAGAVLLPVGISLRVTGGVRAKHDREANDRLAVGPGPGLLTVQF